MQNLFLFKKLKTKIVLGFIFVIATAATVSTYYHFSIKSINIKTKEIIEVRVPLLENSNHLLMEMNEGLSFVHGYFISGYGDKSFKDNYYKSVENSKTIESSIKELVNSEEINNLLDKKQKWEENIEKAIQAYDRGETEKALNILKEEKTVGKEIQDGIHELATSEITAIEKNGQVVKSLQNQTSIVNSIMSVIIFVGGITIALITARSISNPVNLVMGRMEAISKGDLSLEPLRPIGKDEIAHLVQVANTMTENNRALLSRLSAVSSTVSGHSEELMQSANEVKSGTEQVAMTMEELAKGAETQASSAGNLASMMNTFSDKIVETNKNGEQIEVYSKEILQLTNAGSHLMDSSTEQMAKIDQIVQDVSKKMESLDHQSKEISKLVILIKDISDQTNLLALNAAIEAARAGEHGKGFAVVADEVRKLAEQVSISINDITRFVDTIQEESSIVVESLENGYTEVEKGTEQIKNTSHTFNQINTSLIEMVKKIHVVSNHLGEITESSKEMDKTIEDIASISQEAAAGIEQTAASAQQASSSMEEVAGNSEELAKLAEELYSLIRRYKL